jgi:hypothetical protein
MNSFQRILNALLSREQPVTQTPTPLEFTTLSGGVMPENYLALAKQRRTIYALGKDLPLPEDDVVQTIQDAIKQAPSAFNSQSSRALILLGNEHNKFWELVREQLRKLFRQRASTPPPINSMVLPLLRVPCCSLKIRTS